jgi:hypothetical protein
MVRPFAARPRRRWPRPLSGEAPEARALPNFLAPLSFDAGAGPRSVVVVDVNGDGQPDLAAANGNTVSVLLNVPDPPATLHVEALGPTRSGFTARFSRALDPTVLNLYDAAGALGPADVIFTGATTGLVAGSLILSPNRSDITFVQTGGPLLPDTYTLTLRSAADGFKDTRGTLLDGNTDGTPGDDFTGTFTVSGPPPVVVSIPDFMRGPGQAVNVPADGSGLPLRLSEAAGMAVLLFTSPAPLAAGPAVFATLTASVPDTAPYGSKQALALAAWQVGTAAGAIVSGADGGVQVVGYFGDATGNGSYSALDATRALRVAIGLDSGFEPYPLADPVLIADVTGNGAITAVDATRILQAALGIPPLPDPAPSIQAGGPNPRLSIPKALRGRRSRLLSVPVNLDRSAGLEAADLALTFDTTRLKLVALRRGRLTRDFDLFAVHRDAEAGALRVGLGRSAGPVGDRGGGSVLLLTFRVRADAPAGTAVINLRQRLGQTVTQVNEGTFDLNPDPSDAAGDALDGLIRIRAATKRK